MLVNGTAITAVGELTLSAGGEGCKLSAPSDGRSYFLTKSNYASLLKEIESEAKFLKRLLAVRAQSSFMSLFPPPYHVVHGPQLVWNILQVFGGVGAALIAIAAFRWYRKWRAEAGNRDTMEVLRQIQRDRNTEPVAARADNGESGEEDTSTCRVCLQGQRDSVTGPGLEFDPSHQRDD